jgi:thiamine-monophosphate kinase
MKNERGDDADPAWFLIQKSNERGLASTTGRAVRVIEKASYQSAEDRLIERFFRPLARHPGALELRDDAGVLTPPEGADLVVKTDAIVGGVHFFPDDPPDGIGRKALRVNLSDLAAKGAEPAGFLLSLAIPENIGEAWLTDFCRGLGEDASDYKCPLLGGDTDRTPGPVTISIAAFGFLPRATMVRRSGARAGHRVFVTGSIGDAALGLLLRRDNDVANRWDLNSSAREHLISRYLLPEPRGAIALALRRYASAAMDISDGLAGDLAKLCRASGVSADIRWTCVPLSEPARKALHSEPGLMETILAGGDDYEIIAAVPPENGIAFGRACSGMGVAVTDIGEITEGNDTPCFLDENNRTIELHRLSFSHF